MSGDPQYFWDLLNSVYDMRDQAIEEIWDGVDKVADMLNSAASSFGQFLDDILPGENEVEKAIDKWNNEIFPKIDEGIAKIGEELDTSLDRLHGNPADLKTYAEAFANAKVDLYKKASIAQEITSLGKHWSGDAYDAYAVVAEEQHAALLDIAHSLENGGNNTIAAAEQILTLWRKLIREFASYNSDILNLLASATNAANIISFEVPAILETIALIWENVWDLGDLLLEFMIQQATHDMFNWLTLKNGSDGLPANEWPVITEDSSDTMNGPWAPQGGVNTR